MNSDELVRRHSSATSRRALLIGRGAHSKTTARHESLPHGSVVCSARRDSCLTRGGANGASRLRCAATAVSSFSFRRSADRLSPRPFGVMRQPGGSSQDALRFALLAARLKTQVRPVPLGCLSCARAHALLLQPIPREKLATLSFLLSLSGTDTPGPASTSRNPPAFFPPPTPIDTKRRPLSSASSLRSPNIPSPLSVPTSPNRPLLNIPTPPITARKAAKLPMASYLASHRVQTTARLLPVPEGLLLRDTIYILQGINGQYIRFKGPPAPGRRPSKRGEVVMDFNPGPVEVEEGIEFVLDNTDYTIPAPTRVLLHTIAELGWLYRKIDGAINEDREATDRKLRTVGMVEQSLHAALKSEMTEYYRLIAILEGQLDETSCAEDAEATGVEGMEGGLTLMRLLVWTEDMRLRMRMMGTLVGEVGGASFLPDSPPRGS